MYTIVELYTIFEIASRVRGYLPPTSHHLVLKTRYSRPTATPHQHQDKHPLPTAEDRPRERGRRSGSDGATAQATGTAQGDGGCRYARRGKSRENAKKRGHRPRRRAGRIGQDSGGNGQNAPETIPAQAGKCSVSNGLTPQNRQCRLEAKFALYAQSSNRGMIVYHPKQKPLRTRNSASQGIMSCCTK